VIALLLTASNAGGRVQRRRDYITADSEKTAKSGTKIGVLALVISIDVQSAKP
jgi:hypothetical protein